MNRGHYQFHSACSRLNEFFDWDELDWYIRNIEAQNIDVHDSIKWLDIHTRVNYCTSVDTDPDIESRLLEYLVTRE